LHEVLIVDDNSEPSDILAMYRILDDYKIPHRIIARRARGHFLSMNMIFDAVKTEYLFHLEDDWEMTQSGEILAESLKMLKKCSKIQSVLCRNWNTGKEISSGVNVHDWNGKPYDARSLNTWPGYSLNPSLQNVKLLRENVGYFRDVKLFELDYATRYQQAGYLQGMLTTEYFKHIGAARSAYKLNGTKR
jgi:hypothetical protein